MSHKNTEDVSMRGVGNFITQKEENVRTLSEMHDGPGLGFFLCSWECPHLGCIFLVSVQFGGLGWNVDYLHVIEV